MTYRFGSGPFVIPNLFRDLGFGFKNLGFKAPPCGRGSLLHFFTVLSFLAHPYPRIKYGAGLTLPLKGRGILWVLLPKWEENMGFSSFKGSDVHHNAVTSVV